VKKIDLLVGGVTGLAVCLLILVCALSSITTSPDTTMRTQTLPTVVQVEEPWEEEPRPECCGLCLEDWLEEHPDECARR